ncbi:hypothetical protein Taro_021240 [Colocasia esculenta]|uniref:Uncharacterized protein n=1 Tax=Colocasia esculenta TaxID=4460 RepID=A0A843UYG6_COLES|nr:hypothetical protein [Colocasia esculenta]
MPIRGSTSQGTRNEDEDMMSEEEETDDDDVPWESNNEDGDKDDEVEGDSNDDGGMALQNAMFGLKQGKASQSIEQGRGMGRYVSTTMAKRCFNNIVVLAFGAVRVYSWRDNNEAAANRHNGLHQEGTRLNFIEQLDGGFIDDLMLDSTYCIVMPYHRDASLNALLNSGTTRPSVSRTICLERLESHGQWLAYFQWVFHKDFIEAPTEG